jgi:hypothetical protein
MILYKIERIERVIKNFIYLDEYKMYSLSSQIFEGITEYLVSTTQNEEGEEDTQRGQIGSGRILADIIKKTNSTQEKKYLHDYSYTIFEQHLIDSDRVININNVNKEGFLESITSKSFIKITGKVIFNDIGHMSKVMKDFNILGESLLFSQSLNDPSITSKNIKRLAKEQGLNFDKKFLDSLSYLLDFGFGDQLEVQLKYNNHLFSTNLKREYLRENEDLLIKKYARKTEKEFTILGIITQCQNIEVEENIQNNQEHLKVALMEVVSKFTDMELTFTGKLNNEIMIDPIAIYTEL